MSHPVVRPLADDDRPWLWELIVTEWGLPLVSPSGTYEDPERLDGLVADRDGERVGAVTWVDDGEQREVVALLAVERRTGVGRRLMVAAREQASADRRSRLWLITTDDGAGPAFYDAIGMDRVRVLPDFDEVVRRAKPELTATFDAVELEWRLG